MKFMDKDLKEIKEFLFKFFSNRFFIEDDIISFFESNYEISGPSDVEKILNQDIDLLNLIITPDINFISYLYNNIPNTITNDQVEELLSYLEEKIKIVDIYFQKKLIYIPVDREFISNFLNKLRIELHLPDRIFKYIKEVYPSNNSAQILYKLKKSNISWDENMISFFEMFFSKFKHKENITPYLDQLLKLFVEDAKVTDIRKNLEKRIFYLEQAWTNTMSIEERLNSKGLEFVLTSRTPILDLSPTTLQEQLDVLKEIFFTLFPTPY